MQTNIITQAWEAVKNSADALDLIESNFANLPIKMPVQPLLNYTKKYFQYHRYQPESKGLLSAREAIAKYYAQQNLTISPENIIITASTSESYQLLFQTLLTIDDEILLPNPGYPLFEYLAKINHVKPRFYKLDFLHNWEIDISSIVNSITRKSKILVLISPNNPTGAVINDKQLAEIAALAQRYNLSIVADEVFSEFLYTEKIISPDLTAQKVLLPRPAAINKHIPVYTLNGISKMFALPDLKLAWIAASGKNIANTVDELETLNDTFLNANYFTQSLLPQLFELMPAVTREIHNFFGKQREVIKQTLVKFPSVKCVLPQGGIHCVLRVPKTLKNYQQDEETFTAELIRKTHLYLHPGYFYDYGDQHSRYFHLVISLLSSSKKWKKGLARLFRYLA